MRLVPLEQWVDVIRYDPDTIRVTLEAMTDQERETLRVSAELLLKILNPDSWCGACGKYINNDEEAGLAKFYTPTSRWHHRCGMLSFNNHALVERANER